jgi:hypothetical protein
MTLPRLYALNRYWEQSPPMHLLLAGYVGYKPPKGASRATQKDGAGLLADLAAMGFAVETVKKR